MSVGFTGAISPWENTREACKLRAVMRLTYKLFDNWIENRSFEKSGVKLQCLTEYSKSKKSTNQRFKII